MPPVLGVTGATGELGGRVARRLADLGIAQRLVVRDPSRAPSLRNTEAVQVPGYHDAEALRAALNGIETLYLVSAGEAPRRIDLHTTAVDAAVAAGVERIVYVSYVSAAADATFTFARDHFRTEERIRSSGVAFTSLRSSQYLDFVPFFASAAKLSVSRDTRKRIGPRASPVCCIWAAGTAGKRPGVAQPVSASCVALIASTTFRHVEPDIMFSMNGPTGFPSWPVAQPSMKTLK